MAWLYGIGKAMTALGQDISATQREDEERQREEEAAEARRDELGAMGTARMGMRTGALVPGTPGYGAAVSAISRGGGDPVSAMMPEPDAFEPSYRTQDDILGYVDENRVWQPVEGAPVPEPDAFEPDYRTQAGKLGYVGKGGRWRGVEGAPVAEPAPVRWAPVQPTEDGLMWERHPFTEEVRAVKGPDGVQLRHRVPGGLGGYNPDNIEGLGGLRASGTFKSLAEWDAMTLEQQRQWVADNPNLAVEQQERLRREEAGN